MFISAKIFESELYESVTIFFGEDKILFLGRYNEGLSHTAPEFKNVYLKKEKKS